MDKEKFFIKTILEKTEKCTSFLKYIDGDSFSKDDVVSGLYTKLQSYHKKSKSIPSIDDLKLLGELTVDETTFFEDKIFKTKMGDAGHDRVIDIMKGFEKADNDEKLTIKVKNNIENNNHHLLSDDLSAYTIRQNENSVDFSFKDVFWDEEAIIKAYDSISNKCIPSYFPIIDDAIVGFENKTITVIFAGTGVGKSQLMFNFATRQVLNGKNILFFSLEVIEDDCIKRFNSIRSNIPLDTSIPGTQQAVIDYVNENKPKLEPFSGKFLLKTFFEKKMNSNFITSQIKEVIETLSKENKILDCVYVDYFGKLEPNAGNGDGQLYQNGKAAIEELRGVAIEFDLPIITACQLNRGSINKPLTEINLSNAAESVGIAQTSDCSFILGREPEIQNFQHEIHLKFEKLRNRTFQYDMDTISTIYFDIASMKYYDYSEYERWMDDCNISGGRPVFEQEETEAKPKRKSKRKPEKQEKQDESLSEKIKRQQKEHK